MKNILILLLFISTNSFAQNWSEILRVYASDPEANDFFGSSVSMSGEYAIVGASLEDEDANGLNSKTSAGSAYIFKRNAGTWTQVQKIVASDRSALDRFGFSVAISGNYAVVGSPFTNLDQNGNNSLADAGAAYIFMNTGGTWVEMQKIVQADRDPNDSFGLKVAIAGDFLMIAASANEMGSGGSTVPGAAAAYFFKRDSTIWSQTNKVIVTDDSVTIAFANDFALTPDFAIISAREDSKDADGNNPLVAAGAAYVYKNTGGNWSLSQKLVAADRGMFDSFGTGVAIEGDYAIVGAQYGARYIGQDTILNCGAAYVFKNNAGTWSQVQKLTASEPKYGAAFGLSIGISGDYAVISAYREWADSTGWPSPEELGAAYVFQNTNGTWVENAKLVASDRARGDRFGNPIAIAGSYVMASTSSKALAVPGSNTINAAGAVYIFRNNAAVGVVENTFGDRVSIYPNPSTEFISFGLPTQKIMGVKIFNNTGQLLMQSNESYFSIANLADGIYTAQVESEKGFYFCKVLKQ